MNSERIRQAIWLFAGTAVLNIVIVGATRAEWSASDVPVSIAVGTQQFPIAVSDGGGGAIFTWMDTRNGATKDIYAQRINALGTALWTINGLPICTAPDEQYNYRPVSDGSGGAFVVWDDYRDGTNYHVYAQRIDGSGNAAWAVNGAPVFTGTNAYATAPDIAPDGAGGAFVAWADYRIGLRVYVQHLDAAGNALWAPNGIALSSNGQFFARVLGDGTGGAIVVWGYGDIYAQRIDAGGNLLWGSAGVPVSAASDEQREPQIIADGAGGVITAWTDYRNGASDIYAQRLAPDGTLLWQANGVGVCIASNEQAWPTLAGDGMAGVVVTWRDARAPFELDIYAQHLSASGADLWDDNGIAVCTAPREQYQPQIVATGQGHTVIVWEDRREGTAVVNAQHLNVVGVPFWATDGIAPSSFASHQTNPTVVADGQGAVIVGWTDFRSGSAHIYAQRMLVDNPVPVLITAFEAKFVDGAVMVHWNVWADEDLARFTLYRHDDVAPLPIVIADGRLEAGTRYYVDASVEPGNNYRYELVIRNHAGDEVRSPVATATVPALTTALTQNAPNPFNLATTIEYTLAEPSPVSMIIYDATGALVVRLDEGIQDAGKHGVEWDGRDSSGRRVGSGVYFYRLEGMTTVTPRKMLMLK